MFGTVETFTLDNSEVLLSYLNDANAEKYPTAPAVLQAILKYPMIFKGSLDSLKVPYSIDVMNYLTDMAYQNADYFNTNGQQEEFGLYLNQTRYQAAIKFFDLLAQFIRTNNPVLLAVVKDVAMYAQPSNANALMVEQKTPVTTQSSDDKTPETKNYTWWYVGGGALVVLIIIIFMMNKKRR